MYHYCARKHNKRITILRIMNNLSLSCMLWFYLSKTCAEYSNWVFVHVVMYLNLIRHYYVASIALCERI